MCLSGCLAAGTGTEMPRRRFRNLALSWLFEIDLGHADPKAVLARSAEESSPAHHAAHQAVLGVLGMQAQADQIIGQLAKDWSIERMPPIDRNILRLAIWEMVSGLSPAVAINEAVELAKAYGAEDSPAFINGVLAGYLKREEGALSG